MMLGDVVRIKGETVAEGFYRGLEHDRERSGYETESRGKDQARAERVTSRRRQTWRATWTRSACWSRSRAGAPRGQGRVWQGYEPLAGQKFCIQWRGGDLK